MKLGKTCVSPRFEMEYPGIFLEYSNLIADPKKIKFLYVHVNALVYIPIVYFYSIFPISKIIGNNQIVIFFI